MRNVFVLLGLSVLLVLVFPVHQWLHDTPIASYAVQVPALDLQLLCVVVALVPAWLLFRNAQLDARIPRRSARVAWLALFTVLFVVWHLDASFELVRWYAQEYVGAARTASWARSYTTVAGSLELVLKCGVLASFVAVLMRLEAPPGPREPPPPVRRSRK